METGSSSVSDASTRLISHSKILEMVDAGRIVVAFQGGVYDVTEFTGHPGGVGRLQMAAGGDLSVFWKVYTQHNRGHIVDYVMKPYQIGVCSPATMAEITAGTAFNANDVYAGNPEPYPDLLINTRYPLNAEGRLADRTDSWVTPIGRHFVRNHNAVPDIDPKE
jgi:sulfite oxidase